jgi:hypothetical protein
MHLSFLRCQKGYLAADTYTTKLSGHMLKSNIFTAESFATCGQSSILHLYLKYVGCSKKQGALRLTMSSSSRNNLDLRSAHGVHEAPSPDAKLHLRLLEVAYQHQGQPPCVMRKSPDGAMEHEKNTLKMRREFHMFHNKPINRRGLETFATVKLGTPFALASSGVAGAAG